MKQDMLENMFKAQLNFMNQLKIPTSVDLKTLEGQNSIRSTIYWVVHELFEGSEWLQRKPWRKHPPPLELDKYKMEIADALIFFIELCILSGISAKELYKLYHKKYIINLERQANDY